MPVNGAGFWQVVGEVDDQPVPDVQPDQRSRDLAVVGPRLDLDARLDLNRGDAGLHLDLENPRIGIQIDRLGEPDVRIPIGRGQRLARRRCRGGQEERHRHLGDQQPSERNTDLIHDLHCLQVAGQPHTGWTPDSAPPKNVGTCPPRIIPHRRRK